MDKNNNNNGRNNINPCIVLQHIDHRNIIDHNNRIIFDNHDDDHRIIINPLQDIQDKKADVLLDL
jgi:hypothetical protein